VKENAAKGGETLDAVHDSVWDDFNFLMGDAAADDAAAAAEAAAEDNGNDNGIDGDVNNEAVSAAAVPDFEGVVAAALRGGGAAPTPVQSGDIDVSGDVRAFMGGGGGCVVELYRFDLISLCCFRCCFVVVVVVCSATPCDATPCCIAPDHVH
jgi:hypothetical protein